MTEHQENSTSNTEHHGSVRSYVTGFVLSIVLTIIPFLMVRNQMLESTPLLIAVLVFAVLQMFIQMFFFLHLGRGPKPFYNIVFLGATSGMIVLVIGASMFIMNSLYDHMSPEEVTLRLAQDENIAEINGRKTGACQGNRDNHTVMIGSDGVSPSHVDAHRCDTLTIKSSDGESYELMFGPHHEPISYGGMYEVPVRGDRAKIITLNEIGVFSFHDASQHHITGGFSVEP